MNLSSLLSNLNYGTILLLMLIESTVIPFPSEVVVAPAAYHAAAGYQNVYLVVLFATIGADLGAIINYAAAYYLGRPLIYSFARSKWGRGAEIPPPMAASRRPKPRADSRACFVRLRASRWSPAPMRWATITEKPTISA